jgi:hypothetical protein
MDLRLPQSLVQDHRKANAGFAQLQRVGRVGAEGVTRHLGDSCWRIVIRLTSYGR